MTDAVYSKDVHVRCNQSRFHLSSHTNRPMSARPETTRYALASSTTLSVSGFGFGWVVVLVGFELYRRARARVWDAGRLGCGTFSDASCICVVGSVSAFRIFSHFRWASCSLCELHLRERILHRIVEFRSPLRGALCQPAVQPHFVLAVRRGAAAEFRRACFRLSAECVR